MNITFIKYDSTGLITQSGSVPEDIISLQGDNVIQTDKTDPSLYYVKNGVVTDRLDNPATLSGMTITNVPNPTTVTIENNSYQCTDGVAELSFSQVGTYTVYLSSFPFKDTSFEVTYENTTSS